MKEPALQTGQRRTQQNFWKQEALSLLEAEKPPSLYLENRIHLEVRVLVYDPLLLVPEMSSARKCH